METDHNISDKCIVLLSGIPGSGKSTLANILQEQLKDFWVKLNNESDCDNQLGCSINVVTIPYDELIPDHIVVHDEVIVINWIGGCKEGMPGSAFMQLKFF